MALKKSKSVVAIAAVSSLLLLVACGDDDSDFATRPSDDLSSSVSSSSRHSGGLSSLDGEDPESSSKGDGGSDAAMTSSSIDDVMYSFGVTPKSSNNETSVSSSSTRSSSISEYIRVPCDVETDENCFEDARDGQTYRIVKIGDQVWMAENLNYETANSYCYDDSAEYCDKYGRLYTWAAAMDSAGIWSTNGKGCGYGNTCSVASKASATLVRGVCPEGWHLPTQTEWKNLFTAVGGSSVAGIKLKSTSGWNSNGSDTFLFSGHRYNDGRYASEGGRAYFWSSSEYNSDYAYSMHLYYNDDGVSLVGNPKDYGFSVRCVKD